MKLQKVSSLILLMPEIHPGWIKPYELVHHFLTLAGLAGLRWAHARAVRRGPTGTQCAGGHRRTGQGALVVVVVVVVVVSTDGT